MAARKNKGTKDNPWPIETRERIQTSMLVNRLVDHVLGKVELSPSQVTAGLGLMKKVLPDLQATTISGDLNVSTDFADKLREARERAKSGR